MLQLFKTLIYFEFGNWLFSGQLLMVRFTNRSPYKSTLTSLHDVKTTTSFKSSSSLTCSSKTKMPAIIIIIYSVCRLFFVMRIVLYASMSAGPFAPLLCTGAAHL